MHLLLCLLAFLLPAIPNAGSEAVASDGELIARVHEFLRVFADGNTADFGRFYAEQVIIPEHSTLLMERYGKLGPNGNAAKDVKVSRDEVVAAYARTIRSLGGRAKWRERGRVFVESADSIEIRIFREEAPEGKPYFGNGRLHVGDVVVRVRCPKESDDPIVFGFRQGKEGLWHIVLDEWN